MALTLLVVLFVCQTDHVDLQARRVAESIRTHHSRDAMGTAEIWPHPAIRDALVGVVSSADAGPAEKLAATQALRAQQACVVGRGVPAPVDGLFATIGEAFDSAHVERYCVPDLIDGTRDANPSVAIQSFLCLALFHDIVISCDPLVNAWKELDPRRQQIVMDTLLATNSDISKGILRPCIEGLRVESSGPLELQATHLELRSHLGDAVVEKACVLGDRLASVAKERNIEAVRTTEARVVAAIVPLADSMNADRIERWRQSQNAELSTWTMLLIANRTGKKALQETCEFIRSRQSNPMALYRVVAGKKWTAEERIQILDALRVALKQSLADVPTAGRYHAGHGPSAPHLIRTLEEISGRTLGTMPETGRAWYRAKDVRRIALAWLNDQGG